MALVELRRWRPEQKNVGREAAIKRIRRKLRSGGFLLRCNRRAADSWDVVDGRLYCVIDSDLSLEQLGRNLGVLESIAS